MSRENNSIEHKFITRRDFIKGCACAALFGAAAVCGNHYFKNQQFGTKNSPMFPYIEIHLADHCNLKCKYCCHFSPLADENFYDLTQFENEIQKLSEITKGNVNTLRLVGGEPLLNPKTIEYFPIARQYFPIPEIALVTNGILLNRQNKEFWQSLSKYRITLDTSVYNIDVDWQNIKKTAKKYKVSLLWNRWRYREYQYFHKIVLDLTASQTDLYKCKKCYHGGNYIIKDGRIYACAVTAYINFFNKYFNQNIQVSETDYIDLFKLNDINELINWAKAPKDFCKYCSKTVKIPWKNSATHDITEWT